MHFLPYRWKRSVVPKWWYPSTKLDGVNSPNNPGSAILILTTVRTLISQIRVKIYIERKEIYGTLVGLLFSRQRCLRCGRLLHSKILHVFLLAQYCSVDNIEKNEMGGAFGAYGGEERRGVYRVLVRKPEGK